MPFDIDKMLRRRRLLGMSQHDLAVTAGVSPSTIQNLEQGLAPDGGGKTGIDVLMRVAQALQVSPVDFMIPPTGNRYKRAVQFALNQQSPAAVPKLHDRSRTVMADGYRKLTGAPAAADTQVIEREEADAPAEPDREDAPDRWMGVVGSGFQKDPSSE